MKTRHIPNQKEIEDSAPVEVAAAVDESSGGPRVWLAGAYALLVAWGLVYLVLFFTDRLPF